MISQPQLTTMRLLLSPLMSVRPDVQRHFLRVVRHELDKNTF
jgi:hypothetical protein